MNNLSKNLHYLIKKLDTTQAELAAFAEVSQNSISNWINEISYPNAPVLVKIHQYFGVSIDALLLTDIETTKIITDKHIADFKQAATDREKLGNVKPVSKDYLKGNTSFESTVNEPQSAKAMMSQLKKINEKIDKLRSSVESIPKKK